MSQLHSFAILNQVTYLMMAHISDTDLRVIKVTEKFSETVHLMLNDPSMGLYRLQEHVKRSVPNTVEKKVEVQHLQSKVQGACYDLDYSLKTIKSINWNPHFTIIQECLKSAITSKTNLQRKVETEASNISEQPGTAEQESVDLSEQDPIEGFICPACMKVWQSQEDLIAHWAAMHDSTSDTNEELG